MKKALQFSLFLVTTAIGSLCGPFAAKATGQDAYNITFTTLMGEEQMPLSDYRGKVILVVNTASKCGFTDQYRALQDLYARYHDKGLVVIGVPSNDFGNQEPGNAKQISEFCSLNYGVSFPMTSKQRVTGANAHPFYQWTVATYGKEAGEPSWNFHKFLIDRQGNLAGYFYPVAAPDSKQVVEAVEKLLNQP